MVMEHMILSLKIMFGVRMDDLSFVNRLRESRIPVCTVNTASRMIGKDVGYTSLFLHRLKNRGVLKMIEKGKYALPDADVNAVASNLITPSYISLLSAYSIHGLTTQIPVEIQVLTTHNKRSVVYDNTTIRFIKVRPYMVYGILKTGGVSVAEKEKAVADSLRMPEYCSIRETYNALAEGDFDANRLVEYTRKTRSQVALKRLGYLLERTGVDVSNVIGSVNVKYQPLNPLLPEEGVSDRRWKLMVNEEL